MTSENSAAAFIIEASLPVILLVALDVHNLRQNLFLGVRVRTDQRYLVAEGNLLRNFLLFLVWACALSLLNVISVAVDPDSLLLSRNATREPQCLTFCQGVMFKHGVDRVRTHITVTD